MIFRSAEPQDAAALAELIYIADCAHYETSGYAFSIGGKREHQLAQLAALTITEARSQFHYTHFDVAVNPAGTIAASVAAFGRSQAGEHALAALSEIGWTSAQIENLAERLAPFESDYPEEAPGTWTIEHVAALPAFRGQGLIKRLLECALERGAGQGFTSAAVDVFTGNTKAQALYESFGFQPTVTFGHMPLKELFGRDPLIRLIRSL